MAAFEAIGIARGLMRQVVDFGGLHPASHRDDFLGSYVPISSTLTAGPPPPRVRQALALMAAGLLRVVGPDVCVTECPNSGSSQSPLLV